MMTEKQALQAIAQHIVNMVPAHTRWDIGVAVAPRAVSADGRWHTLLVSHRVRGSEHTKLRVNALLLRRAQGLRAEDARDLYREIAVWAREVLRGERLNAARIAHRIEKGAQE